MASRKRRYKRHHRKREQIRTVPDLAAYATANGMPATLTGVSFRIEIHSGQAVSITEHRYMLR